MNPRPLLLVILLLALILATADLLVLAISVLLLVFAGLLFAIFIYVVSSWLAERTGLSYRLCYAVFVLAFVLLLAAGFYCLGSHVVQGIDSFWSQLQSAMKQAHERLSRYEWAKQYLPDLSKIPETLSGRGDTLVPSMMAGLRSFAWFLTAVVVIFFVGLYGAFEPELYRAGLIKLVPPDRRGRADEVLHNLRVALSYWMVGRLVSMTTIGTLTAIGLWILGVPLPVTLGAVAALLTFIPNIGPLLAAVPQVLLALNVGPQTAMYVIVFNLALEGIESYLVTPIVQRREVTLPPILTIASQLLMGLLIGGIGILLAAPLVVVAMVLTQMLYIQDRLGDAHAGQLTQQDH